MRSVPPNAGEACHDSGAQLFAPPAHSVASERFLASAIARLTTTAGLLAAVLLAIVSASPATLASPGEVTNLVWCAASKTCLEWTPVSGATEYRLHRGEEASLPCVLNPAHDSC